MVNLQGETEISQTQRQPGEHCYSNLVSELSRVAASSPGTIRVGLIDENLNSTACTQMSCCHVVMYNQI